MTETSSNIPNEYMTDVAIRDFLGTVERGTLDSRDAQMMHAEGISWAVLKGDLLWARHHAITLALHRDNRPTYDEVMATRDARAEYAAA